MDLLTLINGTPLPTILVVGGMFFIALALGSSIAGKIEMPAERQKMSGILGAALLVIGLVFYFLPSLISASPASTTSQNGPPGEVASSGLGQPASSAALPAAADACFDSYFSGLAADRMATVETGAQDQVVISAGQSKSEPFGLLLTRNRQVVGGMVVNFFVESELFKITNVVDAQCSQISSYENVTSGGDQNTLRNWEELELRTSGLLFNLHFDYSSGEIKFNFDYVAE